MDLANLFAMQRELGKVGLFNYKGLDRFNKLILALLVEIGECANEWRGFKFWSTDQNPRMRSARAPYMDLDDADFYNPLLEEYVDGLHFILELGIERDLTQVSPRPIRMKDKTRLFNLLYDSISQFYFFPSEMRYQRVVDLYIGLGQELGFTWEQVEQAYKDKHAKNLQRQKEGY